MFSSAEHPLAVAFNLLFHRPAAATGGPRFAARPGTIRRHQAEADRRIRTRLLGLARRLCARLREPEEAVHEAVARLAQRPRPAMESDGQTVGYLGRVLRSVVVGRLRGVSLDGGGLGLRPPAFGAPAAARALAPAPGVVVGPALAAYARAQATRDPTLPHGPADPSRCIEAVPGPDADGLAHLEGLQLSAGLRALCGVERVCALLAPHLPPTALQGVAAGLAERAQRVLQAQGLYPGPTPAAPGQTTRGKRERRALAALNRLLPRLDADPDCAPLAALVRAERG